MDSIQRQISVVRTLSTQSGKDLTSYLHRMGSARKSNTSVEGVPAEDTLSAEKQRFTFRKVASTLRRLTRATQQPSSALLSPTLPGSSRSSADGTSSPRVRLSTVTERVRTTIRATRVFKYGSLVLTPVEIDSEGEV